MNRMKTGESEEKTNDKNTILQKKTEEKNGKNI